ncbi:MAG: phosphoribosylpyrophosphate synthetase [Bdellovibrionaceae bacterium]|nr:phosphoribosylpyrophosphate synthetase [Pseudobdellovibrionaceae bacterium]|tara:strand:+ start:1291 stop:2256 length:966 start_codon:yes stop_codon:yes gene_type:complete
MAGLRIFSGNSNINFARKVAEAANLELGHCDIGRFADGEVQVEIHESVRGCRVFLIQSTPPPVNENYMELFMILDALKRASAAEITLVMPYYGYARQDRKVAPRAPISAKCVAELCKTSGADRLVVVDLHSSQIQGFFDGPVDHLFGIPTLARAFRERQGFGDEYVVVSPDAGGVERARAFSKRIECSIAIIDKRRTGPNEAKAYHLIGDVEGKTAIILDDMIDTAGTLTQGVDSLLKNGAKRVFAVATHPVLSGPAITRITESQIEKVWVTDTIPLKQAAQDSGKFEVISVAPVVAEAIQRIYSYDSVSALFEIESEKKT